jgi:hypothetical protein
MPRPSRRVVVVGAVLLLIGAEVALRRVQQPAGCLVVGNQGDEPIVGLVASCGASRAEVARIAPGETAKLFLVGPPKTPLRLTFRQRGNALTSFEVPEFDTALLRKDGSRLVLNVRTNEVERYQEEDDPSLLRRNAQGAWDWLERWLESL